MNFVEAKFFLMFCQILMIFLDGVHYQLFQTVGRDHKCVACGFTVKYLISKERSFHISFHKKSKIKHLNILIGLRMFIHFNFSLNWGRPK